MSEKEGGIGGDPWGRAAMPLCYIAACFILSGCMPGQMNTAFKPKPPTEAEVYCCAVEKIFVDESCETRPVVPQPAWAEAMAECRKRLAEQGRTMGAC